MQKSPHMLIEGMIIGAYAAGANKLVHLHPRRVRAAGRRSSRRRSPRPRPPGYLGENILGSDHTLELVRPPRRRRVHLRRGDRPARLARGQARQPAPQAAVPGRPGPLPGPDADQQRRDAVDRSRTSSGWAARSTRSSASRPRRARSSSRSPATSSARATTRSSSACRRARSSTASPAARPTGREVKFWFPGGSSSPVLLADDLDLPYDFDSMAKAGSMLGSGAIIVVDDTARRSSTSR